MQLPIRKLAGTPRCGVRSAQRADPASRKSDCRRAGLTILEMLVSTAMLSFIVLGLTAVFIQTQKAFKTGIKQNTITDAGRSIIDLITSDLKEMADSQNTNVYGSFPFNPNYNPNFNFYWDVPLPASWVTNYLNGVAIRTNQLNNVFILEHTNTTWIGVGYAVSNYPGVAIGSLYRYETNWTSLAPVFTNDLFTPFYNNISNTNFNTNYWHKVADGVIDLEIHPFDQFGNENEDNFINKSYGAYSAYPIFPTFETTNSLTNTLPTGVELEFGILEPDTLVHARGLTANPTALTEFLSSNAAPNMEVFRQRITIAAASR
jgi:type II secretory pathway pseudopilin PulG